MLYRSWNTSGQISAGVCFAACVSLYISCFLRPLTATFYAGSALVGLGVGTMWAVQGHFVAVNSHGKTVERWDQRTKYTGRLLNIGMTLKVCQGETLGPVWFSSKFFTLKNSVLKSLQKVWSENTRERRPRGSSIKRGEIWPAKFGQMCLPQIFQVHLLQLFEL